jgi:hypothetical protein
MTGTCIVDTEELIAQHPEHCYECYRLIRPGETYHQMAEFTVLCLECASKKVEVFDTVQASDDLLVEVGDGSMRVRRGDAVVVVYPAEVRHLVDALVESGVQMAPEPVNLLLLEGKM